MERLLEIQLQLHNAENQNVMRTTADRRWLRSWVDVSESCEERVFCNNSNDFSAGMCVFDDIASLLHSSNITPFNYFQLGAT